MARERSAATPGRRASKSAFARRRKAVAPTRAPRKGAANVLDGPEPTVEGLFHLQRSAGNRAVASLLAKFRSVQRDTETLDGQPAVRKGPSDIDLGFNALDTAHRLIEAIDQSQRKLLKKGDPGFVAGVNPIARQINFTVVHDQLKGLTASQVKEVEARYLQYEGRALYVDLLGRGQSGAPPNLTVEQIMRLKALLGGTRVDVGEDPELAAQRQREADTYELRAILKGNPKGGDIERVMTLVRRAPDESEKLVRLYDGNWNLNADLLRMGYINAMRAMMLLAGSHTAADAYAISQHRVAITEIDKKIAELDPPGVSVTDVLVVVGSLGGGGGGLTQMKKASIAALKAQRKTHVDAIEERVKFTAEDARAAAEAGGEDVLGIDEAIRARVTQVLGGDHETERVVGGTQGKLISAIARADPSEQAAAEMRKLEERGQLTTEVMGDMFRSLRQQAEVEAARLYPEDTAEELAEHTRLLSDQWFIHLQSTWNASVVGNGRTFNQLLDRGDQSAVDYKRALYMASGRLSDVNELVFALRGGRKDLETVKRVLRNKTRTEIDELKRLYKIKTTTATNKWGGSLDLDLVGWAPTRAGEKDTTLYDDPKGKAQGTDRLLIEDYLQRPYREGGKEEVNYIVGRAEREHEYTIENRGATGWWRDHWGNEARSLLDATLKEVRAKRDTYYALTKNGTDRAAMRSRDAKLLIRDMHFARATIRGDRAGYEKATAELRATFQAIASFVLQAVLTAVLTPAAAALFRGISAAAAAARYGVWLRNTVVSMSSTIAANKAVYGNEYTREMLYADLRGGLSGAIGSAAVGKLVDPVAGRLQSRLGKEMAGEFVEGVKSYGGLQATAALEGDGLVSFDEFAKQHFLGKVGERITGVTARGLEHVGYGPGPTHAPYDPDEATRTRTRTAADGTGTTGHEDGRTKPAAEPEAEVDVDEAPVRVPMALPPELNKPAPRSPAPRTAEDSSGTERSQSHDEPPQEKTPKPVTPADPDLNKKQTPLTKEERRTLRKAEAARRAEQYPLDEQSMRSSTAPNQRTRALATEYAPLFEQFKTIKDVVPRSQAIAEVVRRQLAADGVHDVGVFPEDLGDHTGADFNVVKWRININSRTLAVREMTVQQFSSLIEAATHEARHALHHWRGLRVALQTGKFRSDSRLTPNPDAVDAARAANGRSAPDQDYSEPAVKEAWEVYEQTFGKASADSSGERGRAKIIADRDDRRVELEVAKDEVERHPAGSPQRQAAEQALALARKQSREAYQRYLQLPQEIDAFRRGMAMKAAMVEAITMPKLDAARLAAREATAEQVKARRRGDKVGMGSAKARFEAASAEAQRLRAELDSLPHRQSQQRTTLAQDYAFAKDARDHAKTDTEAAKTPEDKAAAIARYKEAADEMRLIRAEMEISNRGKSR